MLELTTSLLIFIATMSKNQDLDKANVVQTPAKQEISKEKITLTEAPVKASGEGGVLDSKEVEEIVRTYFADTPILAEIAKCESRFRQYDKEILIRGEINSKDVGVMQINEYYHQKTAEKLGYDIHTLKGNMDFAKYLYEKEGSAPWVSSSKCWKKSMKENGIKEIARS